MLEKYHKLQLKPKTTDDLKVALQTIWEELPHEHVNKVVANFTKCLTVYVLWLLMVVIPASAVTLPVSKSASPSHHKQTGSFQSHQQTNSEDNARNAEKGGLPWLK